jgi:hypothetical protein
VESIFECKAVKEKHVFQSSYLFAFLLPCPGEQIFDSAGHPRTAAWRDADGSVFLPFDPAEVMQQFWSEKYRQADRSPVALRDRTALVPGYYLGKTTRARFASPDTRH